MSQLLSPNDYASLNLSDQWIEDEMQRIQAARLLPWLDGCETVLELGYGSGIITRALVAAGKRVTTVDGARAFVDYATRDGATGVHSLFQDYNPGTRFDCVIASFVLEHVEDDAGLLKKAHQWSDRLIVAIGNAKSYHRQLAVQMGLQPALNTLSARDKAVGHYRVYDTNEMFALLWNCGWPVDCCCGVMFKPLPNSMLVSLPRETVVAMCEIYIESEFAANTMFTCVKR